MPQVIAMLNAAAGSTTNIAFDSPHHTGIDGIRAISSIVGAKLLPVEAELAAGLKELGFKKNARTWTTETADAFQLVNMTS